MLVEKECENGSIYPNSGHGVTCTTIIQRHVSTEAPRTESDAFSMGTTGERGAGHKRSSGSQENGRVPIDIPIPCEDLVVGKSEKFRRQQNREGISY
jgi:hypothetical protein